MGLEAGSRVGPYEIVARVGAGGMGEVWRARDTRLERTVALKTLPAELAADAQFRVRFEREAKTISQLNHPNICTLHDVGENYLVMEYLEGETLADRLARGALPLEELLRYGIQIGEALDRAHRQKVVHRDLKPGNIMLTKSGAKLLDFGLAKSAARAIEFDDATHHQPLTREGTILGTFQYMAPEQLEGEEADVRTDIFAFGALLYEMATGRRAFEGKSKTSLIAAIVSSRPEPISSVKPVVPAALDHVVEKCLEKDPDKRWQTAQDIVTELQWISQAGSKVTVAPYKAAQRRRREVAAWALASVLGIAAVAAGVAWYRGQTRQEGELRFVIEPAEGTNVVTGFDELGTALSPDGKRLVFAAVSANGRKNLYVRSLSEIEPKLLPETEDASYPFWSADGRMIAFFADGMLKKVAAEGGPAQVICNAPSGRGGSWGPDGTILFAPSVYSAIYSVPAAGGQPSAVTKLGEADVTHRWPHWLPNGRDFLYVIRPKQGSGRGPAILMTGRIGSTETKSLMDHATNTVYAGGKLYFGRDQRLMAQEFDLESKSLAGDAVVAAPERLSFWEAKNLLAFTATERALVYLPEDPPLYDLEIVDRTGRRITTIIEDGYLGVGATFSPDQKKIAYSKGDGPSTREDIWIWDTERSQETRFTFEPGRHYSISWLHDGSALVFGAAQESLGSIYRKPLRGGMKPELLVDTRFWKVPGNTDPEGRIIFMEQASETGADLWILAPGEKQAKPFLQSRFNEDVGVFSPDGQWVAYQSDESGRPEIYVRRASGSTEQWQVSSGGGLFPIWRDDGREIIYDAPDGKVFAVPVDSGEELVIGTPVELFVRRERGPQGLSGLQDVTRDGKQFLMITSSKPPASLFRALIRTRE